MKEFLMDGLSYVVGGLIIWGFAYALFYEEPEEEYEDEEEPIRKFELVQKKKNRQWVEVEVEKKRKVR